jgi:pimeloyl-ACP methyl ester carboxylesterase
MLMSEPNYKESDLAKIHGVKIAIVDGEKEEIIKPEHTSYLGKAVPGAKLIILGQVSHFAPMQKPDEFNAAMLAFLSEK